MMHILDRLLIADDPLDIRRRDAFGRGQHQDADCRANLAERVPEYPA